MCCSSSSKTLSRLGILWGMCALATLLTAFVSNVWVFTKEPVKLPNTDITTSISFRIGLWRVCPSVKRINSTIHMPSPACSLIKYSGWEEIKHSDLGVWTALEFTPSFITRMRVSTPFEATSVILVLLGTVFAMIGHCNSDNKTLIACGLFILGGLSLGSGLVIFASVLSEAYMERPLTVLRAPGAHAGGGGGGGLGLFGGPQILSAGAARAAAAAAADALAPPYDYKYGWSFFAAGAAFIMAEIAALLSMTAYLRRFPTVEDMVRVMVPGAERKLREHQHLSSDYLVRHSGHPALPHCSSKYPLSSTAAAAAAAYHGTCQQYDAGICTVNNRKCDVGAKDLDGCDGPLLLNKTAPDICTSNNETSGYSSEKVDSLHVTGSVVIPGLIEQDFTGPLNQTLQGGGGGSPQGQSFAGQTVPIKIKHNHAKHPGSGGGGGGGGNHVLQHHQPPYCYADHLGRYGTLPSGGHGGQHGPPQAGILAGVCDMGGSSSSTSSSYCSKSKTLQHPSKHNKKSVTIGTFSTMDTAFPLDKRTNTIGYSGSAV